MPSSDPPSIDLAQPEPQAPAQPQSQGKNGGAKPTSAQDLAAAQSAKVLSNAELKKQAKAEKAARRQQALAEKQGGGVPQVATPTPGPQQKGELQKGTKAQQKRRPSTSTDVRSLPLRGAQKAIPVIPTEPKKEDKTVEFFRHLYKLRSTSIAGASKEVHPAVLALGLQMSNYTICGSCARLVATLQAFKRVS